MSRKRINKDVITVGQGSSGKAAAAGNFNIGHHRHRRTHDSRFKTLETGAAGRDQYSSITNGGDAGIKSRAACVQFQGHLLVNLPWKLRVSNFARTVYNFFFFFYSHERIIIRIVMDFRIFFFSSERTKSLSNILITNQY